MANRLFRSQFLNSFFCKPVRLAGYADLVAPTKSSVVTQGLTLTAVDYGVLQNTITIAFTPGATAGSEVVTVTGKAISVQIATGVSTVTQVRTAMQAAAACTALVTTTGTSAATVATAAAVPLAGAVEQVSSFYMPGVTSILQAPALAGTFVVTLQDTYSRLVKPAYDLQAATAVDFVVQQVSESVSTTKLVTVNLLTGATATDVGAATRLYLDFFFNDSSLN